MELDLIYIILIILSFSVALNLKLTLKILSVMNEPEVTESVLPFESGEPLPVITFTSLLDNTKAQMNNAEMAKVILFLSTACPKCKQKIPEIEPLLEQSKIAGFEMYLISYETPHKMKTFLQGSRLSKITFCASKKDYKKLNPNFSTPSYIFTNHLSEIAALGAIGDEDWMSFMQQMQEYEGEVSYG